ncbi:hypothetical protein RMSM_02427 [Rhodopirellula maiorica SM1]|uniref:Uncharacterized protein n=1 Tax=Rhodopirellula maiorica SM1 TaxID=1265738 RepID=M5S398_9BACT|nr:hypothetical protein [Rhodopirellula maiorica]EMI20659.1 hypothetical protein RMSM_02427 [Rhodopirellula maiorica SM1]
MVTPIGMAQEFSFRQPLSKTVLGDTFPKAGLVFRGENRKETGGDYEQWEENVGGNVGIIRKFVREELDMPIRMDEARLSSYIKRYAATHPRELFLLHFNCRAKLFDFHADKFWVGHYLQQQGVQCENKIDPTQTVITVPSTNRIKVQHPLGGMKPSETDSLLLFVRRNQEGVFDWDHHEFVYLSNVDADANALTVERGAHGTTPKQFESGQCYITQIKLYRDRLVFNLSPDCPRSPDGKQAADVILELLDSWFRKGGQLEPMDGIAFDVQYWDISPNFDTNLDGIADGGIIDGQPRWAQGVYQFSKSIREHFGDDFIITSDGHRRANAQAIGIHNGIESEGLVQHNDGWRGISRTVNTHRYWNAFNTAKFKFNYVASKLVDRQDAKHSTRLRRFAHAMAACLGAGCTDGIEDVTMGIEEKKFWLGKAVGPMVNLAETSDKIVYEMPKNLHDDDLRMWSSADDTIVSKNSDGGIAIRRTSTVQEAGSSAPILNSDGYAALPSLSFEMTLDLPPGDLFLTFDAKSSGARTGFPGTDIPRLLSFDISGHHEDPRVGKAGRDIWTLIGPRDYFKSEFYVRNAGGESGKEDVTIRFEIDGQEELFLKNLVIRNTPAVYVREFENGVALVNPGLSPFLFDLEKQFGGHTFRRIQGSHNDETADVELNNGTRVHNPRAFEVGPVSAQFLIKG